MDIGDKLVSRHYLDRVDIEVEKKVKHTETPNWLNSNRKHQGQQRLRGTRPCHRGQGGLLQGPDRRLRIPADARWRKHIYPDDPEAASKALVFPCLRTCHRGLPLPCHPRTAVFVEKDHKYFLRAVIEGLDQRHLDLGSFQHVVVKNPEGRSSSQVRPASRTCSMNKSAGKPAGQTRLLGSQSDRQLHLQPPARSRNGGPGRDRDHLDRPIYRPFQDHGARLLTGIFKKILLLLEDHPVRSLLHSGETIRIDFGEIYASLDVSQLGRSLNICFGRQREKLSIDRYLERLPSVALTCKEKSLRSLSRGSKSS